MKSVPAGIASTRLRLVRSFAAPRERVFRAFTDPHVLTKWFGPPGGSAPSADIDLRIGGDYRIAMLPPIGDVLYLVGTYREVRPPERLSFTWVWEGMGSEETLVTLEFMDRQGLTEMVLTHERFPTPESRGFHENGWTSALERLEAVLLAGSEREGEG